MTLTQTSQVFRGLPPQHKRTVWIINGRKEMVQQIGPDAAVDPLHAKAFGKLAQGNDCNRQVLDGLVAGGE